MSAPRKKKEQHEARRPFEERMELIPLEMRDLPQWVASALDGKPVNISTGYGAKINDPATWSGFDDVVAYCAKHPGYLPAFAITGDDPYVIIDLDNKPDKPANEADLKLFAEVLNNCDSYTERSRSGHGWHVVVKGDLSAPAKTAHVEVYARDHFMTFTGDLPDDADGEPLERPIAKRQKVLDRLVNKLGWRKRQLTVGQARALSDSPAPDQSDNEVVSRAKIDPTTGDKFVMLYEGEWDDLYASQSEADFAYIGMLWNASGNVAQVEQLWRASALAERAKGQRADYIAGMLAKVSQSAPKLYSEEGPASMFSDLANAKRIEHHMGSSLIFVPGMGWHVWSGVSWRNDALEARRVASKLGRIIMGEASEVAEKAAYADEVQAENLRAQAQALFKHAGRSELAAKLEAAMKMAEPLLRVDPSRMDADPYVLGCSNGAVNLRTGALLQADPEQFIGKTTGVEYDARAQAPTWEAFLARIFRKHPELPEFMQRLAGYWLTGLTDPPYLAVLYGVGANGKSTLVNTITHALGGYAGAAPPKLLMMQYGQAHPTELASLQGKRFVAAAESGEGGRLDEERIKALTGSDLITARRMREDFYSFRPTHKLALMTNHKPIVRGVDEGIWRRLLLIPFDEIIPERERDPELTDRLRSEAPGVLAWAVRGAKEFLSKGLQPPRVVTDATKAYRSESDVLGTFITEECEIDARAMTPTAEFYAVYERWCEDNGERALPKRTLGLRLQDRGIQPHKGANGQRCHKGLRLRERPKY